MQTIANEKKLVLCLCRHGNNGNPHAFFAMVVKHFILYYLMNIRSRNTNIVDKYTYSLARVYGILNQLY